MPVTIDYNVQESEVNSAQLAKQDAELAAAKQVLATCERVRPATYVHTLQDLETISVSHDSNVHPRCALHMQ
jgi:hypothetical protein